MSTVDANAALPQIESVYTPSSDERWHDIAKKVFNLDQTTLPDKEAALDVAAEWLKATNPHQNKEVVSAGEILLIPAVPGVQVPYNEIAPPQLPEPPSPPPKPEPPIDPPLGPPQDKATRPQHFRDQVAGHRDCFYRHYFYTRRGPLQTLEFHMGDVVWVEYRGYISTGVGPITVSGLSSMYVVYEAELITERRWQWQGYGII